MSSPAVPGPSAMPVELGNLHRIGGGRAENLGLKPAEATIDPPGISLLCCPTPQEAAHQIRTAFPAATRLHEAGRVIGSTTAAKIRAAGFEVIPDPTRRLPNHYRLIHPAGVAGFTDENLAHLSNAFTDTSGH